VEILEINGRRLSCTDTGSGQPLVFVHGVGTSGGLWADDLASLGQHCRLIVYDRRATVPPAHRHVTGTSTAPTPKR
jgi:pimeloyl-ACP methyl ester carboxylesterase